MGKERLGRTGAMKVKEPRGARSTIHENLDLRFARETTTLFRTRLLTAAMFGAMLSPLFGVVDFLAWKSWWPTLELPAFIVLRFAMTLWFTALWVWLRSAEEFPVAAMDWLIFAPPAIALGYMTAATGGAQSPYVAGITLLVTARTILVPGEARQHLPVVSFLVAVYPLSILFFGPAIRLEVSDIEKVRRSNRAARIPYIVKPGVIVPLLAREHLVPGGLRYLTGE